MVSAVALAPQVSLGLDQTRMGRPAKNVRVHLIGSYTPLPAGVSARLLAIVGGETIDTWQVDERGLIDRWPDVPDRLLQRYTTVGISMNVAGNTGRCGEFQPLTLTIDGDSGGEFRGRTADPGGSAVAASGADAPNADRDRPRDIRRHRSSDVDRGRVAAIVGAADRYRRHRNRRGAGRQAAGGDRLGRWMGPDRTSRCRSVPTRDA